MVSGSHDSVDVSTCHDQWEQRNHSCWEDLAWFHIPRAHDKQEHAWDAWGGQTRRRLMNETLSWIPGTQKDSLLGWEWDVCESRRLQWITETDGRSHDRIWWEVQIDVVEDWGWSSTGHKWFTAARLGKSHQPSNCSQQGTIRDKTWGNEEVDDREDKKCTESMQIYNAMVTQRIPLAMAMNSMYTCHPRSL